VSDYGTQFESIQKGDYLVLERVFTSADFEKFSTLSHDNSRVHWDSAYAEIAGFNAPIVPAMLYSMILSEAVGMYLPGRNALIGGVRFESITPLYYNEKFSCSFLIVKKDNAKQTILIRMLGRCGTRLIFKGAVTVKVRDDVQTNNRTTESFPSLENNQTGRIVIVGGGSVVGQGVAKDLAMKGRDLIVLFHKDRDKAQQHVNELGEFGVDVKLHKTATVLDHKEDLATLDKKFLDVDSIVFLDCPPVNSKLEEHLEGSYNIPRMLAEGILPHWLDRQKGQVIYVGTGASLVDSTGVEDYSVGKMAGVQFFANFDRKYRSAGVSAHSILLDAVRTPFLDNSSIEVEDPMDPLRAVSVISQRLLEDQDRSGDLTWVRANEIQPRNLFGMVVGTYRSVDDKNTVRMQERPQRFQEPEKSDENEANTGDGDFSNKYKLANRGESDLLLLKTAANVLDIPIHSLTENSGMGVTPEWTSIKHIELVYAIEKAFGLKLSSFDVYSATTLNAIRQLIRE
jgi:short-subunit dehydrogenase/acyl dehydratase/acyl carrier protein